MTRRICRVPRRCKRFVDLEMPLISPHPTKHNSSLHTRRNSTDPMCQWFLAKYHGRYRRRASTPLADIAYCCVLLRTDGLWERDRSVQLQQYEARSAYWQIIRRMIADTSKDSSKNHRCLRATHARVLSSPPAALDKTMDGGMVSRT